MRVRIWTSCDFLPPTVGVEFRGRTPEFLGVQAFAGASPEFRPHTTYSSTLPLLSPYLSIATPALLMTASHRFDAGVEPSLTLMWRLPLIAPAAPPTKTIGRLVWMCWLPLLI